MPFVRFRVDRVLKLADLESAEGKDNAVAELAPIITPLPASAMRDELTELAAAALGVNAAKFTEWIGRPRAPQAQTQLGDERSEQPSAPPVTTIIDPGARIERAFLVQCLAQPQEGREALTGLDLEADLVTPVFRRVAALVLALPPGSELHAPPEDEELGRIIAELQVRAAQNASSFAALTAERLRLQLARVEREIQAAEREPQRDTAQLVRLVGERETLRDKVERQVEASLEQTRETQS